MPIIQRRRSHNYRMDQGFGMPFTVNKQSPQYKGLAAWLPDLASNGSRSYRDLSGRGANSDAVSAAPSWINTDTVGVAQDYGSYYWTINHRDHLSLAIPFSIVFWARYTTSGNLVVIEKNDNDGFSVQTNPGGADPGTMGLAVDGIVALRTNATFNDDVWHRFIIVVNVSGSQFIYVDGASVALEIDVTKIPDYGANTPVYIGSRAGVGPFTGQLSDIRFYNYLTPANLAFQDYDPSTRYDLYLPTAPRWWKLGAVVAVTKDPMVHLYRRIKQQSSTILRM